MKSAVTSRAARSSDNCCSHGAFGSSSVEGTVPQRLMTTSRSASGIVASHRNATTHAATISSVAHGGRGFRRLGSWTNMAWAGPGVRGQGRGRMYGTDHDDGTRLCRQSRATSDLRVVVLKLSP